MKLPLVELSHLYKVFSSQKKDTLAVKDLSLSIFPGEIVGLVGESGCGKSTVGKLILSLFPPTQGDIFFAGENLTLLSRKELLPFRKKIQMIFQDPFSSLNPRMTVSQALKEPMEIHELFTKKEREQQVEHLLQLVGLPPSILGRFPHEFSGGQRQRIGIARALAVHPQFLICDEPISALDISIQSQIINLLKDLQKKLQLTLLFIAHDISMVQYLSTKIAVMYLGSLVEFASREEFIKNPLHPYTKALLAAIPHPHPEIERNRSRIVLSGEISPPPSIGCAFAPRCPLVQPLCLQKAPQKQEKGPDHWVSCHFS